ncbi:hypothetical protein CMV_025867 [Castanea mollissima]|uniref:Uncharacterized protein n=1 Tax=Castanea mollissima TaxID=60419 RepID=A0A8J4VAZ8_9ROSI|nr:hypothetical protein CMV_025867 [Castanea mollissima]
MPSAEDLAFPLYSALSNFISWFVVSGRRDKITSIAMYICPLSTLKFQNLNVTNSLMISKQQKKTLHDV